MPAKWAFSMFSNAQKGNGTGHWYRSQRRRSTKTISSNRSVQVHRKLISIGLLRYRQSIIGMWPNVRAGPSGSFRQRGRNGSGVTWAASVASRKAPRSSTHSGTRSSG